MFDLFGRVVDCFFFFFREYDSLLSHDVKGNCKKAFDAGEILGIPRLIEPADMDMLTVPDKLAVMTYLYQLRAHFTGNFYVFIFCGFFPQ